MRRRCSLKTATDAPFIDTIRKIDAGEQPYDVPPAGWDTSSEPAFFQEWELNNDALTFLGHSVVAMIQVALKLYLDAYKREVADHCRVAVEWVSADGKNQRGEWFGLYGDRLVNTLGVDWKEFGEQNVATLEQITFGQDDILHRPDLSSVSAFQTKHHSAKYTESFFANERFLEPRRRVKSSWQYVGDRASKLSHP